MDFQLPVLKFQQCADVPPGEQPHDCVGWDCFRIASNDPNRGIFLSDSYVMHTTLHRQAYAWCMEHIEPHDMVWYSSRLYLRNPEDAFSFKIAWC